MAKLTLGITGRCGSAIALEDKRWKRYRMYAWQCVHTVVADDTTTADRRVVGPSKTKSISF